MGSLGVLLEQIGRPSVQRIVYVDGPAILEWSSVRHQAPDVQFLRAVFAQLWVEGFIATPAGRAVYPSGPSAVLPSGALHCPGRGEVR